MKDWCGTAIFAVIFLGGWQLTNMFLCFFFRLRWNWLISTISLRILGSFHILGLYPFSSHSILTPQNGFPPHFWIDQKTRIFLHVHCPTGKHSTGPPGKRQHATKPPSPLSPFQELHARLLPIGAHQSVGNVELVQQGKPFPFEQKKGVKLRAKGF